jgi:hypothetical protein
MLVNGRRQDRPGKFRLCEPDGEGFHRASVARRVFAFSAASVGDAGIARRLTCPRFDRWLLFDAFENAKRKSFQ